MKITNLEIENFRGIDCQKIDLSPNVNLFFGINGSGKSSILDAIAISLSWLVQGIEKIESKGQYIPDDSIKIGKDYASIQLTIEEAGTLYKWENVDFHKGYPADKLSNFLKLNELVYKIQKSYKNFNQLPIVVYYPTNRIAEGLAKDFLATKSFSQIDVYENSLGNYANFKTFFEWFRLQDDIVNEHSTSRAKWMREHKEWILSKIKKIVLNFGKNIEKDRFLILLENNDFLLEEPRFIIYQSFGLFNDKNQDEMEYLFHKIARLLIEDDKDHVLYEIQKTYSAITDFVRSKKTVVSSDAFIFLWNIFLLSVQLSFWNLSQKGRDDIDIALNRYNPFGKRAIEKKMLPELSEILEKDKQRLEHALDHKDRELKSVTNAIEKFIPEYQNLRVTRIPTPRMLIDKNGETLSLNQLSDGEKNMIAMIGDIARRLAMANPKLPNPLDGNGIVLIDEIDLHLHPSWQRVIISKLTEVFPNCQFIVTTHSPQVIGEVHHENIFSIKDGVFSKLSQSIGLSSSDILEREMETPPLNEKVKLEIDEICNLIDKEKYILAKEKIRILEEKINGDIPDTVRMKSLITMLE